MRPVVYRFFGVLGVLHTEDYFSFLFVKKGQTDNMLVCSETPLGFLFVGIRCGGVWVSRLPRNPHFQLVVERVADVVNQTVFPS